MRKTTFYQLLFNGFKYIYAQHRSTLVSFFFIPSTPYLYDCIILFKYIQKYISMTFFLSVLHQCFFLEKIQYTKQILGPYRNSSLRILDSDFWALGHIGNSRVSSIVNLQCHLTQGIVYLQSYLCSCNFYFNSEEH